MAEKKDEGLKEVLKLISKTEYRSTKKIKEMGEKAGLWKNWSTYNIKLTKLQEEGKIESIRAGESILWKRK